MNDTRTAILGLGEELIRTKGYHAFSYKDISIPLQIKNAAIHYHFPTKAELGVAVMTKNLEAFRRASQDWAGLSSTEQLEKFISLYQESCQKNWVCVMGALAPTYDTLPAKMQLHLRQLGQELLDWLIHLLEQGRKDGSFHFPEPAPAKAHVLIGALVSSLLLNKVLEGSVFDSIKASLLQTT